MLALMGAKPVRDEKIAPWPFFDSDEIEAAKDVLVSGKVNYWTGSLTRQFEDEFARYHSCKFGIALSNGTLALELALYGLDIGVGDEVITSSKTFVASASCIVQRGATPVIADVDLNSQNMTVETIEAVVTPKTRAIIVVHLGGYPCDMPAIMAFAKSKGLFVIEDCAQAHGAKVGGRLVGTFGDISAFSFCQDKIMSTGGEGGIVILNDESLFKKMWSFKDHGKSYDLANQKMKSFEFRWLHEDFGTNWRFTEFQAAIALRQLGKLESWVSKRRELASGIMKGLSDLPGLSFSEVNSEVYHSYYRLYAFVDLKKIKEGWSRSRFIEAVNAEGIPCMVGSCSEIYLEKAFIKRKLGPSQRLPNASSLSESSIAFLVHPTLDSKYVEDVISAVRKVYFAVFDKAVDTRR